MISMREVAAGYGEQDVLKGISLDIGKGEFTVIMGPNGAGKSTLLYSLIGYLPLRKGDISILGKSLTDWNRKELARIIALIPQETVPPFDYTVEETVLMGRYPWLEMLQKWSAHDSDIAADAMEKLELTELKDRFMSQLSGGEKQRVLLARALAQQTEVILLDESLSQLDIRHQIEMMQLLDRINRTEGKTIILISHNLNLAANTASRLVFLRDGRILANGPVPDIMNTEILRSLFDVELTLQTNPYSNRPNVILPGIGNPV